MLPGPSSKGGTAAAAAAAETTTTTTRSGGGEALIPWHLPPPSLRSHLLRLHNEILSFWAFTRPTRLETRARAEAAQRLRSLVSAIWPGEGVLVEVFGSSATGLALPGSDVDVVVRGATGGGDAATRLRALAAALARSGVARDLQLITRARVPLVKYVDAASGLAMDASFDAEGGPAAARRAVAALGALPAARPLLSVLKASLAQRGLSEVYTGGLGSYALLVMVVAFLQGHRSRHGASGAGGGGGGAEQGKQQQQQQQRNAAATTTRGGSSSSSSSAAAASPLEPCLGTLILDFCALYGRQLDYDKVGVRMLMEEEEEEEEESRGGGGGGGGKGERKRSAADLVDGGGVFFAKTEQQRANSPRPGALTVLDPCDPSNDLSSGSFHIARVRSAFDHMGTLLATPLPEGAVGGGERCSLLARCIRIEGALRGRDSPFFMAEGGGGGREEREERPRRGPPPPLPRSALGGHNRRREDFASFPRGGGGGGGEQQQHGYYQLPQHYQQQQPQFYRPRGGGGGGGGGGGRRF